MRSHSFGLCGLVLLLGAGAAAAAPRVDVVVGADAPRLERFAAQELAGQFKTIRFPFVPGAMSRTTILRKYDLINHE